MASKKATSTKPAKNNREARKMRIYRLVFIVVSVILLLSMALSMVTSL
jgi:hypothetical protein